MNATSPRSLLVLFLGAALAAQAPAPVVQNVEGALPASTYAVVRFGGLQACAESAGNLPMAAVVRAFLAKLPPEVRGQHLDAGLDQAADHVQRVLQRSGLSPSDVRTVLQQPMALAMGRLTVEGMGPSVALVVEAGEHGAAIARVVAALEGLMLQAGAPVRAAAAEVSGVAVRHLQIEGGPSVFAGTVGGHFVVTNSRGYLKDLVAVVRGAQPNLAAATDLKGLQQRLPQPALASMFVNVRTVTSMLDAHLPYEAEDFSKALGIGQLGSVYGALTATPLGGCDVMHIGLHGDERGLFKALTSQPVDLAFAQKCSKNTVVFAAGSFDVPAVLDAFDRFVALLPAEAQAEIREELRRDLGRELRRMGSSPAAADGLLRAFGNQVGVALGLEKGAVPKPELLLHLAVRDGQQVQSLLQKVEAMVAEEAGLEWKSRKVGDHEIRFVTVGLEQPQLQLSPCYVLAGDSLLCGSDVAALVRALRQGDKPDESLASQPDFVAMAKDNQGSSGLLHLRLFRAAELGWRSVETLAYPQLDAHKDQVGFGSDSLPDAEAMSKALGTSTFAFAVDEQGITVKNHGTFGLGALFAAVGAAADEVLHRACGKVY